MCTFSEKDERRPCASKENFHVHKDSTAFFSHCCPSLVAFQLVLAELYSKAYCYHLHQGSATTQREIEKPVVGAQSAANHHSSSKLSSSSCSRSDKPTLLRQWIFLFFLASSATYSSAVGPVGTTNVALFKPATQSSDYVTGLGGGFTATAGRAVDGNVDGEFQNGSVSHTATNLVPSWWKLNLEASYQIHEIRFYRRNMNASVMNGFRLRIFSNGNIVHTYQHPETAPDVVTTITPDSPIVGDEIEVYNADDTTQIAELEVYAPLSPLRNVALGKVASQIATGGGGGVASRAVDGNTNGNFGGGSVAGTGTATNPWWKVLLDGMFNIFEIKVYGRTDCCQSNSRGLILEILNQGNTVWTYMHPADTNSPSILILDIPLATWGDEVKIRLVGDKNLFVAELEVYALPSSRELYNIALGQTTAQSNLGNDAFASRAVDGVTDGNFFVSNSVTNTDIVLNPWWKVEFDASYLIHHIKIYRRTSDCIDNMTGFILEIFSKGRVIWSYSHAGDSLDMVTTLNIVPPTLGDEVKIRLERTDKLQIAEVEVFAPTPLLPDGFFFIQKPGTGKVISVTQCRNLPDGTTTSRGSRLLEVASIDLTSPTKQLWYYQDEQLHSAHCPNESMDLISSTPCNGSNLALYNQNESGVHKQFSLVSEENGTLSLVYFKNDFCDQVLDAVDISIVGSKITAQGKLISSRLSHFHFLCIGTKVFEHIHTLFLST